MLDLDGNPVIADFSLAKTIREEVAPSAAAPAKAKKAKDKKKDKKRRRDDEEESGERQHTAGAGTPTYTAPEVVNGAETYGLKADVWSMWQRRPSTLRHHPLHRRSVAILTV